MPRTSQYSEKRDDLLRLVKAAQVAHGRPPSVRSLAEELGVGVATIHAYLTQLADEGMVEWSSGRHRTLRCTEQGLREAG